MSYTLNVKKGKIMEYADLQRNHSVGSSHDKRITNIIINHWAEVKGEKAIAAEKDLDSNLLDDVLDNCFLIEATELVLSGKHKYIYIGKNILDAYGSRATSPKDYHDVDPLSNKIKFQEVINLKKPVMEDGQFINQDGNVVKYRQCLVPLGKDGINVDSIFGGMRFKIFV